MTSAEKLVLAKWFDYGLSQSNGHLLKVSNYKHIIYLIKSYYINSTYEMTRNSEQFHRMRLTDWKQGVRVTIFFLYCNIIWCFFSRVLCFFSRVLCLCFSTLSTSKIKGDLWWDGQFIPPWQVGYSQGCPSLKLPSTCQRRFLINHRRGGENWPIDNLEGKQWYETSTSFKIYVLYHSICFKELW